MVRGRASLEATPLYWRNIIYFSCLHTLPFGALVTGAGAGVFVAAAALYVIRI